MAARTGPRGAPTSTSEAGAVGWTCEFDPTVRVVPEVYASTPGTCAARLRPHPQVPRAGWPSTPSVPTASPGIPGAQRGGMTLPSTSIRAAARGVLRAAATATTAVLVLVLLSLSAPAVAAPSRSHATAAGGSAVRAPADPSPTGGQVRRWVWPLSPRPAILRRFEAPATPYGPGHRGVDLASRAGQAVLAAGAGEVSFAGVLAGRGVVTVTHGELRTTYEPVRAVVSVGERVSAGDPIGHLETRGAHCLPTCLHWGLLRGRVYLDPLLLVGGGPVRLLPLWGAAVRSPTESLGSSAAASSGAPGVAPGATPAGTAGSPLTSLVVAVLAVGVGAGATAAAGGLRPAAAAARGRRRGGVP